MPRPVVCSVVYSIKKFATPAAISLALLASAGAIASDQIHKCVDANGVTVLSDKPCAVVEAVPADTAPAVESAAALPDYIIATPNVEAPRPTVVKEHYTLPPAEIDRGATPKKPLVSTAAPKVDVATLKAAKLKLELSDKSATLHQASLD